jgi:hypothetical protein
VPAVGDAGVRRTVRIEMDEHVLTHAIVPRRTAASRPGPPGKKARGELTGPVKTALDRIGVREGRRGCAVSAASNSDGLDRARSGLAQCDQLSRFAGEGEKQRGRDQQKNSMNRPRWEGIVVSRGTTR